MSDRSQIIEELKNSYWMEMETVQNYLSNALNLDGLRAVEIKESLLKEIEEEFGHAKQLASRIHVLGGIVPGSADFRQSQAKLQPQQDTTDVAAVIKGVIDAEEAATNQYEKLIKMCEGVDYVTQELCIDLLGQEQEHCREFVGFLREYEAGDGHGKRE